MESGLACQGAAAETAAQEEATSYALGVRTGAADLQATLHVVRFGQQSHGSGIPVDDVGDGPIGHGQRLALRCPQRGNQLAESVLLTQQHCGMVCVIDDRLPFFST